MLFIWLNLPKKEKRTVKQNSEQNNKYAVYVRKGVMKSAAERRPRSVQLST